eukprot:scaffold88994_cov50-Phaeocystis_antarctica.AAC.2
MSGALYYHGSPEADAAAGAELGLNYHDNGAPFAAGGITTLLVCWLHPGASEAEVQEIFQRYGKVKEVHIDSAGMIGRSAEAPSLGRGWEYNTPWSPSSTAGRRLRRLRLSTASPSRTSVSPTSHPRA